MRFTQPSPWDTTDERALQQLLLDLLIEHADDEPDVSARTFTRTGVEVTMPGGQTFEVTIARTT